jgi:16S rRNA (adenine1518-N6/adenine1519-N6)-dimethyltransferase
MKSRSAELLDKYGIKLKKSLGQNLLLDPNINRKLVEAAEVGPDDAVFEVGSGAGELTELLASKAREVLTVEIDYSLEPLLAERFENEPKVRLFNGDILNHSVAELVERFMPDAETIRMVSNIPYYITSPILMHFLESEVRLASLTVMIQKEVADRVVAEPGGKDYGILSIACQLYARPYIVHTVSPKCFRPRPKVDSAIVHMPIRENCGLSREERDVFFKIVRSAFGQRRKKLINALNPLIGSILPDKQELHGLLIETGIRPDSRAETIPLQSFIRFSRVVTKSRPPEET